MGSAALEILGLVLCLMGWVGLILACGLPMWQVTAFLDHNIVTAQTTWKGLWMSCVVQSTGHMQCKMYDSVLLYAFCGLLALVPLCWFANIVVREFYDPNVSVSNKYELGARPAAGGDYDKKNYV
ncbi:PREDICTED: claudin-5 [Myotis brandtii]|uniref:claudin-5 n=1 Tax=Myotis brandtii TaxID=109478 RepID=UPI0003BB6E9E|nr:PREDICTED: claudin-5 [Myotis brandtii]